ncbi:MAG: zinc metallopeptidase, partial [Pontiella sp.]|nr:zinc metallopeptidase [Pontiella sp.]
MFMYFDPMYLFFMIPALIVAGIASAKTKGTFNKFSRVAASSRLTGAQAARQMLNANGLNDVEIRR